LLRRRVARKDEAGRPEEECLGVVRRPHGVPGRAPPLFTLVPEAPGNGITGRKPPEADGKLAARIDGDHKALRRVKQGAKIAGGGMAEIKEDGIPPGLAQPPTAQAGLKRAEWFALERIRRDSQGVEKRPERPIEDGMGPRCDTVCDPAGQGAFGKVHGIR